MRYSCVIFLCLSLLYFTTSCNKESISTDETPLVQRIVTAEGDSTVTYEFFYDTAQHLQSVKFENNNGHKWNVSIAEAENDSAIATTLYHQPNGIEVLSTDTLVYSNGKVVKKLNHYSSIIYVYDSLGRLIADSSGYWALRNDHTITHDFSYDQDGDIILAHTYYNSAGTTVPGETMTASYNNIENPYYKIGPLFYILYQSNLSLSRHNRGTATFQIPGYPLLRTEQYSYDYNSGFLIRMTIQAAGSDVLTNDFYY